MPDARTLFDAVAHLDPIILTGLPLGNWAAPQKVRWAEEHFPGTHIITCMARDKYRHMKGADVLVDDRADHRDKWEAAGGHLRPPQEMRANSLEQLAEIYPTVKSGCLTLRPRRRCRPSRPIPARTPARGSTSPARSPRSR